MREEVRESPEAEAAILRHLAGLHAMVGRFELARQLLATSNAAYAELGLTLNAATAQNEAFVELLAGNPAAAEESLRVGYRALEEMGERAFRSTTAALLARAILEQGRDAEAEEFGGAERRTDRERRSADAGPVAPRPRARAGAAGGVRGSRGARARGGGSRGGHRLRQLPGGRAAGPVAGARELPAAATRHARPHPKRCASTS